MVDLIHDDTSERWAKAQNSEKAFWKTSIHAHAGQRKLFQRILRTGFKLGFDFFGGRDVLEIGSGPTGIIYQLEEARVRYGIEPMDMSDLIEQSKRQFVSRGVGEKLPFKDEVFDIVLCLNVLDHSIDPGMVLRECCRVLREGGFILLWVHALRRPYRIFQSLLNKIDPPHPHHFTFDEVQNIADKYFETLRVNIVKGAGIDGYAKFRGSFKVFAANYVTENVWIFLMKKPDT